MLTKITKNDCLVLPDKTHYGIMPIETCQLSKSVNQMSPIICGWKLVKHVDCFGDNRRTKDIRKIKLCQDPIYTVCNISHNREHTPPPPQTFLIDSTAL